MQIPIISHRGDTKPWASIPRINWSHPLTRGLLFYHYDTGAGGYDLTINRKFSLRTANPVPRGTSQWGTGYNFQNTVADGTQYASDPSLQIGPPYAFASGFMRPVTATESDAGFFGRAANDFGSAPFYNWSFNVNHNTVSNTVGVALNSGGVLNSTAGVLAPINQYHTLAASAPAAATSIQWWLNGLPQTTLSGLTIQSVNTGDNIVVGTDTGGPNGYQGWVYWGAFWNRTITQAEVTKFSADPYCFLIYPEDEMLATLVGVAAVTTSEDRFHQPWSSVGRRYAIIAAG